MSPEGMQALKAALFVFVFLALLFMGFVIWDTITKNRLIRSLKDEEAQRTERESGIELGTVEHVEHAEVANKSSVYELPGGHSGAASEAEVYRSSVYDFPGGDLGTAGRDDQGVRAQVAATLSRTVGPTEQDAATVRLEDVWEVESVAETGAAPQTPLTESRTAANAGPDLSAAVESVASDDARSTSSSDTDSVNGWDEEVQPRRGSSGNEPQRSPPPPPSLAASPTGSGHIYGNHH